MEKKYYKKKIIKKPFVEKIFKVQLKMKKLTLTDLIATLDEKHATSQENYPVCSERTIRRAYKSGQINERYLIKIAEILDVSPEYLGGKFHLEAKNRINRYKEKGLSDSELATLIMLEKQSLNPKHHTFFKYQQDQITEKEYNFEIEKQYLSLFNLSRKQLEAFDQHKQFEFFRELYKSTIDVLYKYFDKNAYGIDGVEAFESMLIDLEFAEDYYNDMELAKEIIDNWVKNNSLPKGYSEKDLRKMPADDIILWDAFHKQPSAEDIE